MLHVIVLWVRFVGEVIAVIAQEPNQRLMRWVVGKWGRLSWGEIVWGNMQIFTFLTNRMFLSHHHIPNLVILYLRILIAHLLAAMSHPHLPTATSCPHPHTLALLTHTHHQALYEIIMQSSAKPTIWTTFHQHGTHVVIDKLHNGAQALFHNSYQCILQAMLIWNPEECCHCQNHSTNVSAIR
jgi:hypothetical protein